MLYDDVKTKEAIKNKYEWVDERYFKNSIIHKLSTKNKIAYKHYKLLTTFNRS